MKVLAINGSPNLEGNTYQLIQMVFEAIKEENPNIDTELIQIARGEKPELVNLVHRMMDGEKPHLLSLSEEEVRYVKTVRVLNGDSLYSHSWLEI